MISAVMLFILYALVFYYAFHFICRRLKRYLHGLQQDDYNNQRFINWLVEHRIYDQTLSLGLGLIACLSLFILPEHLSLVVFILGLFYANQFEPNPTAEAKKPLVLTQRASRILNLAASISSVLLLGLIICMWHKNNVFGLSLVMIIIIQALPLILTLSNRLLRPYEASIQKSFYEDAQSQLKHCSPKVIGITGSFGKTSVKHILYHLLNSYTPTLMTPGSVNTVMGITRIIREQLETRHQFFIVEMGAYGQGSIDRLCSLTPPHYGIISSIGHAHYERFKSLENVAQTKFELAASVLRQSQDATSQGPHIFVNQQTLGFENSKRVYDTAQEAFIICAETNKSTDTQDIKAHLQIESIQQTAEGLTIQLNYKGKDYQLKAPLFGHHHGENIALAFVCALTLGVPEPLLIKAIQDLPQIPHRLQKKPQTGDWVILDDAYNSNPIGFNSALDVFADVEIQGRKILITPGIVELGAQHTAVHAQLGEKAAEICDIVCLVQPDRIQSFVDAVQSSQPSKLKTFETFEAAQTWLLSQIQPGDWVLLENDLPDLYERKLQL